METQNLAYLRTSASREVRCLDGGLSKIWEERRGHLVAGLYGAKGLLTTQAARRDGFYTLPGAATGLRDLPGATRRSFSTFSLLCG